MSVMNLLNDIDIYIDHHKVVVIAIAFVLTVLYWKVEKL